jgi:hypothetical protein
VISRGVNHSDVLVRYHRAEVQTDLSLALRCPLTLNHSTIWHSTVYPVCPFHVIRWDGGNDTGSTELNLHDGGGTGSRPELFEAGGGAPLRRPSRRDTSGANGYAIGASRQYPTSRHLEFILKLLLRVLDPDLPTGTKSRPHSRLNLGKALGNELGPPRGQNNHAEQSNRRANGAFLRGMRELLSNTKPTPGFVGDPQGGQREESKYASEKTLGGYTNQTRLQFNPSQTFPIDRRSPNKWIQSLKDEATRVMVSNKKYVFSSPPRY